MQTPEQKEKRPLKEYSLCCSIDDGALKYVHLDDDMSCGDLYAAALMIVAALYKKTENGYTSAERKCVLENIVRHAPALADRSVNADSLRHLVNMAMSA